MKMRTNKLSLQARLVIGIDKEYCDEIREYKRKRHQSEERKYEMLQKFVIWFDKEIDP